MENFDLGSDSSSRRVRPTPGIFASRDFDTMVALTKLHHTHGRMDKWEHQEEQNAIGSQNLEIREE